MDIFLRLDNDDEEEEEEFFDDENYEWMDELEEFVANIGKNNKHNGNTT